MSGVATESKDAAATALQPAEAEPASTAVHTTDPAASAGTPTQDQETKAVQSDGHAPSEGPESSQTEKKAEGRRKSGGGSESKSKKANNRRKSTAVLQLDAKPGDFFMARMKGYPDWPSVVCDEEMIPEQLLVNRPVSAMRPDGTYREDYMEGGKNARERTYAVMFLATNEFMWAKNTDLTPLDPDTLKEPTKKTKSLGEAYEIAKQKHGIDHFKKMLYEHQKEMQELELELERKEAEKEAKKAKKEKATKRKSKDAIGADDQDVEMEDAADAADAAGTTEKKPKATKKRKQEDATAGGDDGTPAKKKINLKINKSANGDTPSSSASKPKAAKKQTPKKPEAPQLSAEEIREQRKKTMMFLRHKLQKGFLSRDATPKEEEMEQMNEFFNTLENTKELDGNILRETKVYKVLRLIVRLNSIPRDHEFKFKSRSMAILGAWAPMLNEDTGASSNGKPKSINGAPKAAANAAEEKDEKEDNPEEPAEQNSPGNDAKDEANSALPSRAKSEAQVEPKEEGGSKDSVTPAAAAAEPAPAVAAPAADPVPDAQPEDSKPEVVEAAKVEPTTTTAQS